MLISRGLKALFLGSAVAATVFDRHLSTPNPPIQISQQHNVDTGHGLTAGAGDLENDARVPRDRRNETAVSGLRGFRTSTQSLGPEDGKRDGRCADGTRCSLVDKTPNRRRQDGSAIATTTSTITSTRTVTSFTGAATRIATVTATIMITVLDVLRDTATSTVTVTAFNNQRIRRQGTPGLTKTEFTTVQVTTTVLVAVPAIVTVTVITFSTTTIAPNARTTTFVTVTTTLTSPSGVVPPVVEPVPAPPVTSSLAIAPTATNVVPLIPLPSTNVQPAPPSATQQTPIPTATRPTTVIAPISSSSGTTMTPIPSTTRTTSTPVVPLPTSGPEANPSNNDLSTVDIIGIVLGSLAGLALILIIIFLLRRTMQRRRRAQAQMRQKLTSPGPPRPPRSPRTFTMAAMLPRGRQPPHPGSANTGLATNGSEMSSAASAAGHSALRGENEVRIVIKPAPAGAPGSKRRTQSSQLWPMPPGHRGQTFSLFADEMTTTGNTGQTTPQDSVEWSIASENGSISRGTPEQRGTTVYRRGGDETSTMEMDTFSSGRRPTTSVFEGAWDADTVSSSRRDTVRSSYVGPLSPPPAWQYAQTRGWPGMESTIPEGVETPPDSRGQGEGSSPPSGQGEERRHGSIWIGRAQ